MEKNIYMNRELSWLSFNERVLDEAGNPKVPLAERLTFASIFQTNLDEFFMVRVGTLMIQMLNDDSLRDNKTEMTNGQQIKAILERVKELEKKKSLIYEQLMGELEVFGIRIINFNRLSKDEGQLLEKYFDSEIAPFLSPMVIGKQQPFPFLKNKDLYALVILENKNGKSKMGVVPCSNQVFPRLIEIKSRPGTFMLCEELILHFVTKLFSNYEIKEKSVIRITRNADIDDSDMRDEDLDYRNFMEHLVKQRRKMSPVRLELSREINQKAKSELSNIIGIENEHIINLAMPLDLKFVFDLQRWLRNSTDSFNSSDSSGNSETAKLFYKKNTPKNSVMLDLRKKIIPQIESKDVLLSYPFESMKPFLNFLDEAAKDKNVVSIKMTLYRVAEKSKIIDALIEAAENGKEVVVLVELRARFDEENNIDLSRKLEDAGCRIIYGLGQYKVHSKLCLVTRHTEKGLEYLTQIGTGNYNEKTSSLYTDFSLITANQAIGKDVANIFKFLLLGETVEKSEELLVAPKCLQNRILEMIDQQMELAKSETETEKNSAYIGIKINSLTDKVIIDKLVDASKAGVKIDLIVRGICCLVPKIPGETENITVISVVGRYLEHSRIYIFGKGENEKIYISSADFMTRNTERRVEVAVPILDEHLRGKISGIFKSILKDDEKGKELTAEKIYVERTLSENGEKFNSQEYLFEKIGKK